MISKLLQPCRLQALRVVTARGPQKIVLRTVWGIPRNQYDAPWPGKLQLGYTMRVYWELIPVFVATITSIGIMFASIVWACNHKVDVVFTTNSRNNISRTMDLRNPTVHKIVTINQRYEPWPEMQDVLDKMVTAEKRALLRLQSCTHA